MCNHISSSDPEGKNKIEFFIHANVGFITQSFSHSFKAETEYHYSYIMEGSNEKLLFNYGFYIDGNNQSTTSFEVQIQKQWFTKEKWELCKKINCLDGNYDEFYNHDNYQTAPARIILYNDRLNSRWLNFLKLYSTQNERLNSTLYLKRIVKNKWINYPVEATSLTLFIFNLLNGETSLKIKTVKIFYLA